MSNSKLIGKKFPVPDKVLLELGKNLKKFSDKRDLKGFNRAIFILEKRACTYEQLKRIKNYFDNVNDDNYNEVEYLLNGGDVMKKWVNYTLDQARKSVIGTKSARKNAGMTNQFRSDSKENLTPSTPTLKSTPEFMNTSELMEEVNKIKEIYKKLN
jgi:signal recognition particle GTPase